MARSTSTPRLTISGLADYMTCSASAQRNVLLRFKYPQGPGEAAAKYYHFAYRVLGGYFQPSGQRSVSWLSLEADELDARPGHDPHARDKIEANVRVLRGFLSYFASQKFQNIQPVPKLLYRHAGVSIRITPDLYGTKRNRSYVVKYLFAAGKREVIGSRARIICQVMYHASMQPNLGLPASGIQIWACRSGDVYRAREGGSLVINNVEAACKTIAAVWPTL